MASQPMQAFLEAMHNAPPKKQVTPTTETRRQLDDYMSTQPIAEGFTFEDVAMAGCPARRFTPDSGKITGAILYLHGGGYYTGSPKSHHALMSHLCVACDALVVGLDYRLAPENPYPAALNDTLAAYRQLGAEMPISQIMVAGDSAGGGLTMACLQSLRNTSEPLPGCAALLSPNVDLSDSGAYGGADNPVSHNNYAGNYPRNHPGISPVFGEMQDLPPILVQFASDEAFANEATRLIEKLRAAGVDVDCQTFDEAFHVFQIFTGLPEALAAIDRIAEYFRHRTMEQT